MRWQLDSNLPVSMEDGYGCPRILMHVCLATNEECMSSKHSEHSFAHSLGVVHAQESDASRPHNFPKRNEDVAMGIGKCFQSRNEAEFALEFVG